ncbi:hypothetical protein FKM82_000579 [Ascaphus truei]
MKNYHLVLRSVVLDTDVKIHIIEHAIQFSFLFRLFSPFAVRVIIGLIRHGSLETQRTGLSLALFYYLELKVQSLQIKKEK